MKTLVFDTNVLLDLFVFNDFRALKLKQALEEKQLDAVATNTTIAEFEDVIARPLFALAKDQQIQIADHWRSLCRTFDDETLLAAPWQCEDPDDQVFINLAYTTKPAILMSKDNALLKLAPKAAADGIVITASYLDFSL
ncbi:putative toxin-antitoxin system toxin component, PIN family [Polynucleobacter meluiroseus]|uniref:Putative toxin-antitoxin system toxin component, PIN family n=1 Tax=Polynucleobacter meluiroseus TaxID=1938814 RepID=A0A240E472_9BURK|nr:putative toxin-antitoxin system toxin component, PIN family [Polynucleobacter meluiroseus]SNX29316.1 putative toxin-antitoxin system toxin component, PIN family [Polynucleobacter meluiroseus]